MANTKKKPDRKQDMKSLITVSAILVFIAAVFIIKGSFGKKDTAVSNGGNIVISKSDVTSIAKFYPYKAGNTNMEVLAVKAPDGTIRTAFNTCQVCYASGRGYYKQDGDELVCQNCGNRFRTSQVEKIKGGCNPVPIVSENKTDNGSEITIPQEFLEQNKEMFGNWRKA